MNTKCFPALWLAMLASCLTSFAQTSVPTVTTLAAGVTSTNATLNGTVNPNGAATAAYFRFGLTTNYDNIGAATILPAANTTLAVPGLVVNSLRGAAGANWTQSSAPAYSWNSIAASSDGMRLAAAGDNPTYGNAIDISTDGGMSWTQTSAPNESWASITSSSDGTRLAAVALDDGIYTSTNGGATWTQTSAPNCTSVVSSYDGQRLAAGSENGAVYTSTNAYSWKTNGNRSAFYTQVTYFP